MTPVRPAETGVEDGLAYSLWLPEKDPRAGVVVVHGAGSSQESHFDFARAALAAGLAAITFDQRGHGQSSGRFDERAVEDVVAMADRLRAALTAPGGRIALRGSSLGGYLALRAARAARAAAIVAICPASAAGLRRALDSSQLEWTTDPEGVARMLDQVSLSEAVAGIEVPVLLLHARGDEQVPVQHSRELSALITAPGSRFIEVPGGHHRSIQHDDELQAFTLRFLSGTLG